MALIQKFDERGNLLGLVDFNELNSNLQNRFTYNSFKVIAGENLSGHKIVIVDDGLAFYANSDDNYDFDKVVGMTLHSAVEDDLIEIVKFGKITNPSWGLSSGQYFLTTNGNMSKTPPSTGFILTVGKAIDADNFIVDINNPILE